MVSRAAVCLGRVWLVVFVVGFFDEGGRAYDVKGEGFSGGGLEGDADGEALPAGGLADGDEVVWLGPVADLLLNDGTVGSKLGDDGVEAAFGGGGGAAVGGVVAEPDGIGDGGVEVGEVEGGDVSGDAVDEEPGAGLPDPVCGGVGGQGIVEAEGAANGEGAIGDFVEVAGGPFLLMFVDEQGADFEGGGLVGSAVGGGVGLGVGNATEGAEGDDVGLGCGCAELVWGEDGAAGEEQDAGVQQQEHRSGAKGLHGERVRGGQLEFKHGLEG